MDIELKTAQLLVSRICHDLAGGISALGTGAELLADEATMTEGGVADADAVALIASSAKQSSHRLQFLRTAFGQGGGADERIAMNELRSLTHGLLEGSRVSLVWQDDGAHIALGAGKLLLNLCLIGSEALPRGGVINISSAHVDGHLGFAVAARGDGARLTAEFHQAMAVDVDPQTLTSRTVNGHFTAVLAAQLAAELEIQADEGLEVRLSALLPLQ